MEHFGIYKYFLISEIFYNLFNMNSQILAEFEKTSNEIFWGKKREGKIKYKNQKFWSPGTPSKKNLIF